MSTSSTATRSGMASRARMPGSTSPSQATTCSAMWTAPARPGWSPGAGPWCRWSPLTSSASASTPQASSATVGVAAGEHHAQHHASSGSC